MVQIFIIFLIIILVLAAIVGAAVAFRGHGESGPFTPIDNSRDPDNIDRQYYDESGNHIYYDRSSIEKAEFIRHHPDEKPRSLRRLFSRRH